MGIFSSALVTHEYSSTGSIGGWISNSKRDFQTFSDLEILQNIAESKGIDADNKSKKALASELSHYVTSTGLHQMLQKLLKVKTLKLIASDFDWGEHKPPTQKGTIANKIYDEMESNPKKFLEKQKSSTLLQILKDLVIEPPDNKKDYANMIFEEVECVGLQNLFSSFNTEKLKEFADDLKLRVESSSQNQLIESIISLEDYKAPKTSKSGNQPSEKKPPIDKNISKVDLGHHYYRDDLIEYCKDNGLPHAGTKKELVDRIYASVTGKDKKDKKRGRKKSDKEKSEKSDEEKSDKEKSDKEKSNKNDKDKKKEDKEKEEKKGEKDKKTEKSEKEKEKEDKKDKKEKEKTTEKEDKKDKKEKEKEDKKENKKPNKEKYEESDSEEEDEPPKKKSKSK